MARFPFGWRIAPPMSRRRSALCSGRAANEGREAFQDRIAARQDAWRRVGSGRGAAKTSVARMRLMGRGRPHRRACRLLHAALRRRCESWRTTGYGRNLVMSSKVIPLRTHRAPNPPVYEFQRIPERDFDGSRASFLVLAVIVLAFWSGAVIAFAAA